MIALPPDDERARRQQIIELVILIVVMTAVGLVALASYGVRIW